ncbi:transmembrane protein, putative [Medicago truncatula]|uniref:Transmembrane protein, putative n=1 Tax=Medicago truncatula TaxID=3880 RepID=G7ZXZ1_MEDTR|nr:transmembrane protein, putative [Medicago truncatula]
MVGGVQIDNPSTVVVRKVMHRGFSFLAAYLLVVLIISYLSKRNGKKNQTDQNIVESIPHHNSPISISSTYVIATVQSPLTTTSCSRITKVAFDPIHCGSMLAVVIVDGMHLIMT